MKAGKQSSQTTLVAIGSALTGALLYAGITKLLQKRRRRNPETDHSIAHETVWACIGGAMKASQLYIGDKLDLYTTLREACAAPGSSITAIELAKITGFNQRWLREWLAQQASMGILKLLPGEGNDDASLHYRLPHATATVLAEPSSKEYDIAMISCVPSLVNRAKTMLPEAFQTGIGRPYDEPDVAAGIDRQHQVEIRETFIPKVIPKAAAGGVLQKLQQLQGCRVADLGCGAGNLVIAMAKAFPNCTVKGYEVSEQALTLGAYNLAKSKLRNAYIVDANKEPLGSSHNVDDDNKYDVITTLDVLHDAPNPDELIAQVKAALKPGGVWLLADICGKATLRENISQNPTAGVYLAFSTCLCMSCSLSTKDGKGLGTLGFSVPVAKRMLIEEGGFQSVEVLHEEGNTRWFQVML